MPKLSHPHHARVVWRLDRPQQHCVGAVIVIRTPHAVVTRHLASSLVSCRDVQATVVGVLAIWAGQHAQLRAVYTWRATGCTTTSAGCAVVSRWRRRRRNAPTGHAGRGAPSQGGGLQSALQRCRARVWMNGVLVVGAQGCPQLCEVGRAHNEYRGAQHCTAHHGPAGCTPSSIKVATTSLMTLMLTAPAWPTDNTNIHTIEH